tara:strand:- start:782 stop:2194 length:1413 start_codon:yes stop_codon:yes gene_type:complete
MDSNNRAPFELIIGLVGGLGTNFDIAIKELEMHFFSARCRVKEIRLTDGLNLTKSKDFLSHLESKIKIIDELRNNTGSGVMAAYSVTQIFNERAEFLSKEQEPVATIYIINSLKHPEEYELLRHIYRRNFVLLSIYENKVQREENLKQAQLSSLQECSYIAESDLLKISSLMDSDEVDCEKNFGRRTLDLYHKSHYFIHSDSLKNDIQRFVEIIFNNPFITPTKEEVGMMYAYYSSLRSSDLSRQVGACILDDDGNVLTLGLNEVPKFGGGLHWHDTYPDKRDFRCTDDNNEPIFHGVKKRIDQNLDKDKNSFLHESLEFIRAVHAEEAAICDAAARGISIKGATLFCTTFPCHLCIKHIIAAGIKEVIYIEPYSKSKSEQLFEGLVKDKAKPKPKDSNILKLRPFKGVCPKRYRYAFNKRKIDRQDNTCKNRVKKWNIKFSNPIYLSHSTPYGYNQVEKIYIKTPVRGF